MILPSKLRSGQNFKTVTVQTINQILDYLKSQRIVGDNKTIKVTQMTAGVGLSVIQNTAGNAVSGNADLNHPFKLSIDTDQNENKVLHIHKGRIALTGDDQSRIYVCFQPNEEDYLQSVPLPDQAGNFHVELFIFYDEENPSENQDFWQIRILYVPVETMTNQMINTSGIYSIIIGDISVSEDEETGDLSYRISSQRLLSDIAMYDNKITQNFRAYFALSEYPANGDILDQPLIPDTLTIQAGYIYNGADKYYCNKRSFTLTDESFNEYDDYTYCACLYLNSKLANFAKIEDATFRYYDERNKMYCIPICKIFEGTSIASLEQYIDNAILIDQNDGKVLLNQNDGKRDYLESKIVYPVEIQSALSEAESAAFNPEKPYIKGITYSSITSTGSGSNAVEIVSLYDRIYWDYVSISGFNASSGNESTVNIQQLNNKDGNLQWDNAYCIRVNEDDSKPGFLSDKLKIGKNIYSSISSDNTEMKIWGKGISAGYNQTIIERNTDEENPYVQIRGFKSTVTKGAGINVTSTVTDSGFTAKYKVEIKPDYFQIDKTLQNDLTFDKNNHIQLKSNLQGKTGIITVKNGVWGYLPVPDTKAVLAWNGNNYKWAVMGKGLDLRTIAGKYTLVNMCCSDSDSSSSMSFSSSESLSSSESISVSSSDSLSSSESISVSSSESQSISDSRSNSQSISVSDSVSNSVSDSLSISVSESRSNSASNSKSESRSNSRSESKSNSASNSRSNSASNSDSSPAGQPINCTNLIVSPLSITGTLEYYQYSCQQGETRFVMGEKYVFHGDTYDFYLAFDDGTYELMEQNIPISNSGWYRNYSCNMYEQPNRVRANMYRGGGYGPYGEVIEIYTYGTYILPWYNMGYDCDIEQEFSSARIVISYPVATITVSKNTEN